MTIAEIKSMLKGSAYDFLRTDPHLGDKIILLTLGGSHSYGLNTETSDVDIRGCALNSPAELIGLSNFEQRVDTATDTTVYGFMRFVQLLLKCDSHAVEMLGCRPEHYIWLTDTGRLLIENRKLFLSQRVVRTFGGYASRQLRRLENGLPGDQVEQGRMEEHIRNSMEGAARGCENQFPELANGEIKLYTGESMREGLDREIFADISLRGFPARDFSSLLNTLGNVLESYKARGHRNNKKDDAHLNKHAMHLVRIYLTGLDILETGDIETYRERDHDLLISIRRGDYMKPDGTYRSEFFDIVSDLEARLKYAEQNTCLPKQPDVAKIEQMVMAVNKGVFDV